MNLQRVDFPIEVYAFQYWIENLASWPNDLLDVGQEYGAGARYHSRCAEETESSLHLAVSAFSLAMFGRANNAYEILQRAERFYARSITELRRELKVLSNNMIDQLLIATMILSKYDVRPIYYISKWLLLTHVLEHNVRFPSTKKSETTPICTRINSATPRIICVPLQGYSKPFASSSRERLYAKYSS